MIPHIQRFRHEPDRLQFGDCHRTALASILSLHDPESAPHFIGEYERIEAIKAAGPGHPLWDRIEPESKYNWETEQEKWLNSLGYTLATVQFNGEVPASDLFAYMDRFNTNLYYLLSGQSPRGTNHTVVACGGAFAHDPHPDGGYLVGPMDNGMWELGIIAPISMKKDAE